MKKLVFLLMLLCASAAHAQSLQDALPTPYPAPEITGIDSWLNSQPLTISGLGGKVVLVDIWTYSCINCVRTLPYLTEWDANYRHKGLVIIGVHSPEFDFEKSPQNVQAALKKYHIRYPVALDNHKETWNAFKNRYWPAHYLIDQQGRVVYAHYGEGKYDIMENNIRVLLGLGSKGVGPDAVVASDGQTPETYLGTDRAKNFVATGALEKHQWTLSGKWERKPDRITSQEAGADLTLHFDAGKVFLVLGTSTGRPVKASLTLNGKPLTMDGGADTSGGVVTVNQHAVYELVRQKEPKEGMLRIRAEAPGLEAYAFTFGR